MKQFDTKVHIRDRKGFVKQTNAYRLRISKSGEVYERPPGSGNFFYPNGEPVKTEVKQAEMPAPKKAETKAEMPAPAPVVMEESELNLEELLEEADDKKKKK